MYATENSGVFYDGISVICYKFRDTLSLLTLLHKKGLSVFLLMRIFIITWSRTDYCIFCKALCPAGGKGGGGYT